MSQLNARIAGLVGLGLFFTFVVGLTYSIAVGFAGFWGAFPMMIIVVLVGALALYDYWDECFRKNSD